MTRRGPKVHTPLDRARSWEKNSAAHLNNLIQQDWRCRIDTLMPETNARSLITIGATPDNGITHPDGRRSIGWQVLEVNGDDERLVKIAGKIIHLTGTPTAQIPLFGDTSKGPLTPRTDMLFRNAPVEIALHSQDLQNRETFNFGNVVGMLIIPQSGDVYPVWAPFAPHV